MLIRILLISLFVLSCVFFSLLSMACIGLGAVKLGVINLGIIVALSILSGFIIEAHYTGMRTEKSEWLLKIHTGWKH